MKKVYIIHTSFVSVEHLQALFAELAPEAEVYHIVDDSLLHDITAHGGVTPEVTRRYCAYALEAQQSGADLIFSQCSSAGPCADAAARLLHVPILKVDQAMAERAVEIGGRIVVLATLSTTLEPSIALVREVARRKGGGATVLPALVEGAFDELIRGGGPAVHNRMVLERIRACAQQADVITLAQGSMVTLCDELDDIPIPVLTSPRLGVERARQMLGL